MRIDIQKTRTPKPRMADSDLGFGRYTTDHMFLMDFDVLKGWHSPRIVPYGELRLDPTAMVLHYNQEVFEGLKAFRQPEGRIALFRPRDNIARLNRSARRMCMPESDPDLFLEALLQLVKLDQDWVPRSLGTALYIRPTLIATEASLGVRPATRYLFFIVLSPVGAYYATGFAPTRIWVSESHVRAVNGGAGEAKTSCNYGPTLLVTGEAMQKGYNQVLWLDAMERAYIEEVGTSNIFCVIDGKLTTPALAGTILPGITRDSVLTLARQWDLPVVERRIGIQEVIDGLLSGRVTEIFASGTAAVISPVGVLHYAGQDHVVSGNKPGPVAQKLYHAITDIQYGHQPDRFGWLTQVLRSHQVLSSRP